MNQDLIVMNVMMMHEGSDACEETNKTSYVGKYKETGELNFSVNGKQIKLDTTTITPKTTLNEYLRKNLNLTGTKFMCLEGGCGSCIVAATFTNSITNIKETKSVNSCLVKVLMVNGWEITTVEGLGNRDDGYNEIQQKVVQFNATQCGFCTPGMVMSMYALQQSGVNNMAQIENSFGSNLCRCTGYRPLLSAFKSMASDADHAVLGLVPDIEELGLCSNKMERNCQKTCSRDNIFCDSPLIISLPSDDLGPADNWYKVYKINDIFTIFKKNPGRSYFLVSGNTAQGVYKDIYDRDYYIDISSVKELKDYSHNTRNLILGANMTLHDVIHMFQLVSQSDDNFQYLAKVAEHIDLVAHVAVRNIGTLAGNLSIKHLYKEFPSDLFLLLETIGAVLVIDDGKHQRKMSPSEYLDMDMHKKIIRTIVISPLDRSYRFDSYKIMKRAQNAHAIINAGFLFKFRNNIVEQCTIVYGGVNPQFIHATKTEALIKGKALFDNNNMQKFFAILQSEINPDDMPSEPSSEFRRQLCVGLFYKYILSIAPNGKVTPIYKSGGPKMLRPPVSTGVQDYKTNTSMYPVGEPIQKLEAADQASGQAKYVTDRADVYGQCFAVFVQANAIPGSILQAIDARVALSVEGVEGFFQASDIPGVNSYMVPITAIGFEDDEIFLSIGNKLLYYSQPVGMIVATSQKAAMAAAKLVKVIFKPTAKSPILTTKDAIKDPARVTNFNTWMPKSQNTNVPVQIDGVFESLSQYHNYMELNVAAVYPEDNGDITIHVGTQWIDFIQTSVMRSMNIPAHKIHVSVKRVGGAFGGKITRPSWLTCAATLAVLKLKKPVKLFMSLEDNMNIIGKRHAMRSQYEVGVDNNGVIGYLNNNIYSNTGVKKNAFIEFFIFQLYEGPYVTDTFYTEIDVVKTDVAASTYMRAPGFMEGSAMIENIVEHIAYKLNKDPIDVRLSNLKEDALLKKMVNEALEWSDYRARRASIEQFNQTNTWRKKGISLVPMAYTIDGTSPHYAQVSIFQSDGTVAIAHGGIEIGQGINTAIAQVVAYLFGLDLSMISIWPANNFIAPNNFVTGGSATTESLTFAVKAACNNLLERINQAATNSDLTADATWLDKVQNAHAAGVSLTENGMYAHDQVDPIFYVVYGVGVSEIELDVLTGQIIVQRTDLLEDTGDSLNPYIDIGQVEGAFVMGMGHWTSEEIIFDDEGALATNSTWTYKIPGPKDIPVDFRVKFPEGQPNPLTPFKNKATAEPPFCLAFSVPLAIRHALKSVRTQFDSSLDPWTTMVGPCSVEWIYLNSNHDIRHYKL